MAEKPVMLSLIVAERILVDLMDKNRLSLIGIFSGFRTSHLPFASPPMHLVARYGLSQGEFNHHFEVQDVSGTVLFKSPESKFFLDNRTAVHTDIAGVEGIIFNHPGVFWIKSFLDGDETSALPLDLAYTPLPKQG